MSNIFDDAYVKERDEESKSTNLESGSMQITVKYLNFRVRDEVCWGIHPENITIIPPESGFEDQNENLYLASIKSIINKGPKKRIVLKLVKHNKILNAEIPAQFVDSLKLHASDSCLVKLEMSKVVAFYCF